MSPFLRHIIAVFVGTGLAAAVAFGINRNRAQEAQELRHENEQLRKEVFAKLQAQRENAPSSNLASAPPAISASPEVKRATEYRFEGQATPVNALQSFAWACDQGDITAMKTLIVFDSAARPLAEAFFATLPAATREKTPDLETLAAMILVDDGMHRPFPRAELLERATVETVSANRARTRLPGTPRDGGLYENVGGRWKFVITKEAVEHYLAQAAKRAQ